MELKVLFIDNKDKATKTKIYNIITLPVCDTNKEVARYPDTAPKATVNYMNVSHNVLFSPP